MSVQKRSFIVFLVSLLVIIFVCPAVVGQEEDVDSTEKKIEHYEDDFTDPESGWPTSDGEVGSSGYGDKTYNVRFKKAGYSYAIPAPVQVSPKEFSLEVTAKSEGKEGSYGILFGYEDSDNWYCFRVTQKGAHVLNERINGDFSGHRGWNESSHVNEDGENTLRVEVSSGNDIQLFVNGHSVRYIVSEADYEGGRVGLYTSSFEKGFEVKFEELNLEVESSS